VIDARAFVDEFVEAIRSEDADRYASLYAEEAVMNPSFPGSTSEPPPPSVAPLSRSIAKEKPMKVPTLEEFVSGHEVRPRVALCPCDAGVRARQATTTRTLTFVRVLILALLLAAPLVAAAGARAHGVPTVQATAAWHTFDSLSRLGGVSTSAAKTTRIRARPARGTRRYGRTGMPCSRCCPRTSPQGRRT
jgi:hypothetical protein